MSPLSFVRCVKSHTKSFLDRLGQRLQLDVRYFISGGFWLSLAYFLGAITAFLVTILFAYFSSKEFYGQYRFILSVIGILSIFSLPGMASATTQAVSRNKERALIQVTKTRFFYSFIGSVALFLVAAYFKYIRPKDFWPIFLFAAVIFPFVYSFDGYVAFFLGKRKFEKVSFYYSAVQIVAGAAVIISLFLAKNLFLVVGAYLLFTALMHVFFYSRTVSQKLKGEDPKVVHYGKHLSYIDAFRILTGYVDTLIVSYFLGFEQLAVYTIAASIPKSIQEALKSMSTILLPKFSVLKGANVYEQIKSKLKIVFLGSIIISVVGIVLSPIFIPILFSNQYAGVVPFAQVMFLSLIVVPLSLVFVSMLKARKRVRALYAYTVIMLVVSVVSMFIFIPLWGLWGAIISRVIMHYSAFVQLWFVSKNE